MAQDDCLFKGNFREMLYEVEELLDPKTTLEKKRGGKKKRYLIDYFFRPINYSMQMNHC